MCFLHCGARIEQLKEAMMRISSLSLIGLLLLTRGTIYAQQAIIPPGEKEPFLRLEAEGPTSFVTSLAFSPDGKKLYAAGWDKVVRVWTLNAQGRFELERAGYRVPIGPGLSGAINAIALSDDGVWLAVGGLGTFRREAGFRQHGWILPSSVQSPEMLKDRGLIYVFNTKTQASRILRGHLGHILSLAFAPSHPGKPALLLSAAIEPDQKKVGVIRLWNAETGEHLDKEAGLPTKPVVGLAIWHTGNELRQLTAALAWFDGDLRFWDADAVNNNRVLSHKSCKYNQTVVRVPGREQVLAAVYGHDKARLQLWNTARDSEPAKESTSAGAWNSFPRSLALLGTQVNAPSGIAATIVDIPTGKADEDDYRLQLLDLDPQKFGGLKADEFLWKGSRKQPALASSRQGDYLAVAGGDAHEIRVYAVRDLLGGQAQPQILHGAGQVLHYVSFVRKGKDLGLLLNEEAPNNPGAPPRAPASGDLIFDFAGRSPTRDARGWQAANVPAEGWRAEQPNRNQPVIEILRDNRPVRRIAIQNASVISDFVLLPPRPPMKVPILALAYHDDGEPRLFLYNAATGEQFRQYTGHVDRIHCLAFSDDGRFLASASEDQTICVWSLTNLDKILGRHGQLTGVEFKAPGNILTVTEIPPESPASGKVKVGEVIEGLVVNGKLRTLTTALAFYEALALMKPGKTATLRVRDADGVRDVDLEVGQGIDERKPLLTLFIAREDEKTKNREWIGWNPIGPYDSSGQKAERLIGWHFNTGDPAAPTRFAFADQYHKQYYRQGLLNDLISQGDLQRVPNAPPPPLPKMSLLLDDEGSTPEADGEGHIPVRHSRPTLKLAITGRPLSTLAALAWKLDDGPEQKIDLEQIAGQEISVPLSVRRGVHKVRMAARTPETGPQEFAEELMLRYQPPPPDLKYQGPRRLIVNEPTFALHALVRPGQPGEDVVISISHMQGDRSLLAETKTHTIDPDRPLVLRKDIKLLPGSNLIEVTAVNQDALRLFEDAETSRLVLEVALIEKARPPLIILENVLPSGTVKGLPAEPGKVIRVAASKLVIAGKIQAPGSENLDKAEWGKPGTPGRQELTGFMKNKAREFTFKEDVLLQPGVQTFRFFAQTANSDEAERSVTLDYQPPVPTASLTSPATGFVVHGVRDTATILVKGRLSLPAERHSYQARLLIDGTLTAAAPVIDDQAQTLSASVPLQAGTKGNRIQVRFTNKWGASFTTEDVQVYFLRPPVISKLDAPEESQDPSIELRAEVHSALPLSPEPVKIEINGKPRLVSTKISGGNKHWTVLLDNVPLEAGVETNEIRVWLANREGECIEPARVLVRFKPRSPPPEVEFLEPRESTVVHTRRLKVKIHVRSMSPLKRVGITREGAAMVPVDVSALRPNAEGAYELTAEVGLVSNTNNLRVEAVNEGGRQEAALAVSLPDLPVRMIIDRLEPLGNGRPLQAIQLPGGNYAFPEVPDGRARLVGQVLWDEADDDRLTKTRQVQIYVNGFQQMRADLDRPLAGSRSRTFRADITLNQARDNQVSLALPDLEQDACSCTRLSMRCLRPVQAQRLWLLPVSLIRKDESQLQKELLDAIQCRTDSRGQLKSAAFDEVNAAPALAGSYATASIMRHQLLVIKERIKGRAIAGGPCTDVVVFYYQGGEAVNANGHFFQTGCEQADDTSLSCDHLIQIFSDMPGAHILLLDVGRAKSSQGATKENQDRVARWEDAYGSFRLNFCVLRYAWLGRGEALPNAGLLKALEGALPKAARLVDVTDRVRKTTQEFVNLKYSQYLAKDLEGLMLNTAH